MTQDWLTARAQASPQALALLIGERQWTYAELDRLAQGCCSNLAVKGIQPGQNVAALLPNGLEYVVLIHALARLGAVLVPLNTRLTPAEITWQLKQTQPTIIVYAKEMASLTEALPNGKWVEVTALLEQPEETEFLTETQFLQPFDLNAPQAIVFTSGATGHPKGVVLTFANHFWSTTASSYRLGLLPHDRWLSCLPLYHVGGLAVVFRSCLYGTAIVLHPRFDLDEFNRSLETDAVTLTSLVPTMLHRLLAARAGRPWPTSLRLILLGGAAASPTLLEAAFQAQAPVATTYGLTEAASQVATLLPAEVMRKPGSVGRPLMFTAVRIVDEEGKTVPPDALGEIVVAGPTVMKGYYKNETATAQTIRNGELFTGDMGYLDTDGDLWVVQRRSDLILSGGENVYPAEVEAVLTQHPAVARACVVGLPHAEWGQQVAALVELELGAQVTAAALLEFSRQRLAGYKQPRRISFTDALPQTASGKIARRDVVEQLARG